jgi:hypothetical protein
MGLLRIELLEDRRAAYGGFPTLRGDCHDGASGFARRIERALQLAFEIGSHRYSCSSRRRGARREGMTRWRSRSWIVCV